MDPKSSRTETETHMMDVVPDQTLRREPWTAKMRWEMQEVVPNIFIGPQHAASSSKKHELLRRGITHIVCLRGPGEERFVKPRFREIFTYLEIDTGDIHQGGIAPHIPRFLEFMHEEALKRNGRVLVVDLCGFSLVAAFVTAYLITHRDFSLRQARDHIQTIRPCAQLTSNHFSQLQTYDHMLAVEAELSRQAAQRQRRDNGPWTVEGVRRRSHDDMPVDDDDEEEEDSEEQPRVADTDGVSPVERDAGSASPAVDAHDDDDDDDDADDDDGGDGTSVIQDEDANSGNVDLGPGCSQPPHTKHQFR